MAAANLLHAALSTADFLVDDDAIAAVLPGGRAPDAVIANPHLVRSPRCHRTSCTQFERGCSSASTSGLNGNASAHVLFLLRSLEVRRARRQACLPDAVRMAPRRVQHASATVP
jgi:hypothetical protein